MGKNTCKEGKHLPAAIVQPQGQQFGYCGHFEVPPLPCTTFYSPLSHLSNDDSDTSNRDGSDVPRLLVQGPGCCELVLGRVRV